MKRSFVNARLREAADFFERCGFRLPPFARWTPEDWRRAGPAAGEIRRCRLGWDLTDFGSGRFEEVGLVAFTLRNGDSSDPDGAKRYCEKALRVLPGQVTPWHFHRRKCEDIIHRGGGGRLVFELAPAGPDGGLQDMPVQVSCDGLPRQLPPRERLVLEPGSSLTLPPLLAHRFHAEPGGEPVLAGEVSTVNDDAADNVFLEGTPRYPVIEEDEPPWRLLCWEYP